MYWLDCDDEDCPHCLAVYAYEVELRCVACDGRACPLCAVHVRETAEVYCPACTPPIRGEER